MAPPSAVTDYSKATDAKDFLDMIGKDVHETVKKEAQKRSKGDLKGSLSQVSTSLETNSTENPCIFEYDKHTTSANGNTKPCGKDENYVDRFSDKEGAQCDKKKIKDNSEGACAPYRRLHVCDKNMVKMDTIKNDSKAKHDLLAEVCYAANYEAESLIRDHPKYQDKYGDSASQLCTELARSFADIGDIVRGRDLYLGKKKKNQNGKETERDQLESKLKEIFQQIHSGLSKNGAEARYQNDTTDYFQLREDWWDANRETVWKAITCSEQLSNSKYFHATCGDSERSGTFSQANHYCRCDGDKPKADKQNTDPPTYFDYVPQFLRWFEEWAEDFCRKKKIYVGIVKTYCRGPSGNDKYCSRNGFDCEKTIRKIELLRMGNQCTKCLFACNPYIDWIEKQKEQFDKQKKKYTDEMKKYKNGTLDSGRKKRAAPSNINYEGYEKIFYEKLKGNYSDVNAFLDLLSSEKACTAVNDEEGGKIDFKTVKSGSASGGTAGGGASASSDTSGTNVESQGTFYRSKYCQPCPDCGVKKKNGKWEPKQKDDKCNINLYKPKDNANPTDVTILKSGEGKEDIKNKIEKFCKTQIGNGSVPGGASGSNSDSKELYEDWKCYEFKDLQKDGEGEDDDLEYNNDVKDAGGLCILQKTNSEGKVNKQKTFNNFFNFWVAHMLKDSIHWRTKKIKGCLENNNGNRCRNGCIKNCKCFLQWVEQKKEKEWKPIKKHFYTQKDICKQNGLMVFDHHYVLKKILEDEFLKDESTDDSEENSKNSLDAEEAEELKRIREIIEKKNQEEAEAGVVVVPTCDEGADNEQKNPIDYLLDEEAKDATKCKDCEQQKAPGDKGPGRTAGGHTPGPGTKKGDSEEDEDEDDEVGQESEEEEEENVPDVEEVEEEEADEPQAEHTEQDEKEPEAEPPTPATTQDKVNPCDIVSNLFSNTSNFSDACTLKYGKNYGWRCVNTTGSAEGEAASSNPRVRRSAPSGSKSDASGSICVPPRRRKLYLGGFDKFISGESSQGPTLSPPSSDPRADADAALRDAFIESAAVETFFLWDRYKKIKNKEKKEKEEKEKQGGSYILIDDKQEPALEPDAELNDGKIPEEFKRQMFYTLADYKDILFSGDKDDKNGGNNIILNASGTEKEKQKMQEIQTKIKDILEKANGDTPAPKSGDEKRKTWWKEYGKHIWEGMLCALTYKDGGEGKTIEKVKTAGNGDLFEKLKGKYSDYEKVKLEDTSGTGVPKVQTPSTTSDTPLLTDFISRPPYFRYLEEWGETFCRERAKRLAQIKHECKVGENGDRRDGKKCSGYGESCDYIREQKYDTISSFNCPGCGKYCRFYKKWIEKKKIEFTEQENAYTEQKDKCVNGNNKGGGDNGFCGKEGKCNSAADFLERLKNGPCKTNKENGEDEIDFGDVNGKTFQHTKHCAPCSLIGAKCKNGHCKGDTNVTCNGKNKTITKDNIERMEIFTDDISMLVSDNNPNGNEFNGLEACRGADIFKGIRNEQWKCGDFCGVDICKAENINGEGNEKQIIQIRALLKRWVENFLEDYNKIRKKLKPCIENGKGKEQKCFKGCKENCDCVKEWVAQKTTEWEKIKKRFNEQYKSETSGDYPVKTILEELITQITDVNEKEKFIKISKFDNFCGCNYRANTTNGKDDAIDCMIKKLKDKIGECEKNHDPSDKECNETLPETHDDENEDENEKKVGHPQICDEVLNDETKKEEPDKKCEEASPGVPEQAAEEPATPDSGKETLVPELPVKPPKPQRPRRPRRTPQIVDHPAVIPALMSSTIMWSIGIGFAAFTYFYLK
ncbi:hypothetical protein PFTANZ_06124, partial [Plasmodium falciparum Tanzania (2000708)]